MYILIFLFRIVLTQKDVRETSPLAKYLSATASLIEGGIASQNVTSFLWILEQNLRVTFHHPDEFPESSTILCMQLTKNLVSVMNTTVEQMFRPQTFRVIWPFYFFSLQMYIPPFATALHDVAWLTGRTK